MNADAEATVQSLIFFRRMGVPSARPDSRRWFGVMKPRVSFFVAAVIVLAALCAGQIALTEGAGVGRLGRLGLVVAAAPFLFWLTITAAVLYGGLLLGASASGGWPRFCFACCVLVAIVGAYFSYRLITGYMMS